MPDDQARAPLDQPAAEPASSTDRGRHRGRVSPLVGWLLVAVAGLGMAVSTPPSAGPDEPAHELTAWYLSANGLRPSSIGAFPVPVLFSIDPCFKMKQDISGSCAPPRSAEQVVVTNSQVLNYPPPYYWFVGAGQKLAADLAGVEYADVGGRFASFILNFGALFLVSLYMRRRNAWWGNFLLLVSTPMAVFMAVVVNPNGWEITCGVVVAAVLSEAVWGRQSFGSDDWSKSTALILAASCASLSLARPLGFIWAAGLTLSALALAPSINRRLLVRLGFAVAPGIALGVLWAIPYHSLSQGGPEVVTGPVSIVNYLGWFAVSLVLFPWRLYQMFGLLGWMDTPAPVLLFPVYAVTLGALLVRLRSIRKPALLCGLFGIVILPSILETTSWTTWPAWWQGRYTLPFALGFLLLVLLRSGSIIPRRVSAVSAIAVVSLGLMVWVNAIRYAFGVDDFGLPVSLEDPGISTVRLSLSALLGLLLVLVGGYLLVQAWRMKPDLRPGLEPETLSTSPARWPAAGNADS